MKITDLTCRNRRSELSQSGLNRLHEVELTERYQRLYQRAVSGCGCAS